MGWSDAHWHKMSPAGGSPASLLRQAKESAAAQQEFAAAARPSAEAALHNFMARRSRISQAPAGSGSPGGVGLAPVLLGARGLATSSKGHDVSSTSNLPVLLGRRPEMAVATPPVGKSVKFQFDPMDAAREARNTFLARRQRIESRDVDVRVP